MKTLEITPQEIFTNGDILTVKAAKSLIGKKIATTSAEYKGNTPHVDIFVIKDIISRWDDAADREYPSDKYANFQDYWKSYMTEEQVDEYKTNLVILTEDGKTKHCAHTKYFNFYSKPTFTGSDADREVFYIEL